MQAERPVGYLSGCPNDLRVLSRDRKRIRLASCKEVEVQDTSNDVILEARSVRIVDLDIHAVGVQEKHTMSACRAMLKVDGVVSVEIASCWHTVRVARPHCTRRVECRQTERVGMLSETIDIRVFRKVRLQTKVLGLKDDRMRRRGEEYFGRCCSVY